jgi:hypothetical protein
MRKLICVLFVVLPVLVFGVTGPSPQSVAAQFQFVIPQIVGVQIGTTPVIWDFGSMAGFPPAAFPAYYEPTTPAVRPHQTIDYLVWGFGAPSTSWQLRVSGNGDPAPACGILLGDIEYAEDNGAGGLITGWNPFTTSAVAVKSGAGSTGGWLRMYQDYQVNIDGDEILSGGSSCTITYTIQTL